MADAYSVSRDTKQAIRTSVYQNLLYVLRRFTLKKTKEIFYTNHGKTDRTEKLIRMYVVFSSRIY